MIIKPKLTRNFTVTSNALAQDLNLSDRAVRLALYIASLPASWKANNRYFAEKLKTSPRNISRAFAELIDAGHIQKIQEMDEETGKFSHFSTVIFLNNENSEEPVYEKINAEISKNEIKIKNAPAVNEEQNEPTFSSNDEQKEAAEDDFEELEKDLAKSDKIEISQDEAPIYTDLCQSTDAKSPINRELSPHAKIPPVGFLSTILKDTIGKKEKLFAAHAIRPGLLLIFEKGAKVKKNVLDFKSLSEEEQTKFWEWVKYKRAHRRLITTQSQQLIINKLEAFKSKGGDPVQIINQSIENGWQGLFMPKLERPFKASQEEILLRVLAEMPDFNYSEEATRRLNLAKIKLGKRSIFYKRDKNIFILTA